MRFISLLLTMLLSAACSTEPGFDHAQEHVPRWPAFKDVQLTSAFLSTVPECTAETPTIQAPYVGHLRAGMSVAEVIEICPSAEPVWDWGDEAIPQPALALRLGEALISLLVSDTLPGNHVLMVTIHGGSQTAEGFGSGAAFTELIRTYGEVQLYEGECLIDAAFRSAPGVVWRLTMPQDAVPCEDIPDIVSAGDPHRIPSGTRVSEVYMVPGS